MDNSKRDGDNRSQIATCTVCNSKFFDSTAIDGISEDCTLKYVLQAFLAVDCNPNEKSVFYLCPTCKTLCANLSETKEAFSILIDKISNLLLLKFNASDIIAKRCIVTKLFEYELSELPQKTSTNHNLNARRLANDDQSFNVHLTLDSPVLDANLNNEISPLQQQKLIDSNLSYTLGGITLTDECYSIKLSEYSQNNALNINLDVLTSTKRLPSKRCSQIRKKKAKVVVIDTLDDIASASTSSTSSLSNKSFDRIVNTVSKNVPIKTVAKERKYICEICGLGYKQRRALETHVLMHTGKSEFECQHCRKSFTQKCGLQRHLPIHTGFLNFQCDVCGKRFLHHSSLKVHKMIHDNIKSHECNCGLTFLSKSHLSRHQKIHTGLKPHQCEICSKFFAERYNLEAHMRIHTGVKKYVCSFCNQGFNRKHKLNQHEFLAHKDT